MPLPDAVTELISDFKSSGAADSTAFKEDWTRTEYIEPFFEALGWTRFNPAKLTNRTTGYAREISQAVAGVKKAPDYGFYVDGRRMFYVEAKKPSVSIKKDKAAAFQIRRYGWNAGHLVGLVTDFQELALYDCRPQPDPDDPVSRGLIQYLTLDDYDERWDWLGECLSSDAVRAG